MSFGLCVDCGTPEGLPHKPGCRFGDDDFFERELGELLAILHRDGWHYLDKHGWAKAVEEGKRIAARVAQQRREG